MGVAALNGDPVGCCAGGRGELLAPGNMAAIADLGPIDTAEHHRLLVPEQHDAHGVEWIGNPARGAVPASA